MMPALEEIRLRMPAKGRQQELVFLYRSTSQHRDPRELAQRFVAQQVTNQFSRRPIENQAEAPFFHAVIRKHNHCVMEIRVHHTRVSDQKTPRKA